MVNILRKVALLFINVFVPATEAFYKVVAGFIFLMAFSRI